MGLRYQCFVDNDSCLLATRRVQRGWFLYVFIIVFVLPRSKMAHFWTGLKDVGKMVAESSTWDSMSACGTDGIGQANGGATMAPCTPGTPIPLTPPTFKAKLFAVDSRS